MMWPYWMAGLFGGLGLGFIAGFFMGSWSLRRIGFVLKVREDARETVGKHQDAARKFFEESQQNPKGIEHPHGPPPLTPSQMRQDPRSWAKTRKIVG